MATSAIGSTDLALLRGPQLVENLSVDITPLTVVQTGSITAIPAKSPFVDVTWNGSTSGIVIGQLVKIISGTTLRTWAVIRKNPSGSILYISTTPLGSAGYTTGIESDIQVGDTVTVYNHHPIWGLYSRIANRTFYKQWDVAYSTQNSQIPPVANTGMWQKATTTGASASFTLPRSGSNSSFAMVGGSVTYSWSLPAGVTLKTGYAVSDAVIEVDATAGYHLVALTVTDTNAKTHTAYMWLFVSDATTGTSLSERYAIDSLQVNITQDGFTGSFQITGSDLDDVIYPGAGILIKEIPDFNGSSLTDGVFIDTHIGYIADINYNYDDRRIPSAAVTFESPLIYAARIPQPTQSLTYKTSPTSWVEGTGNLMNPQGAVYYAIKWHSPGLLDMHDFDSGSITTPQRKFIDYNTRTLAEAIKVAASLFLVHIGSSCDGATVMRDYPQYMDNTDRNALAIVITWQAQDFRLPLEYQRRLLSPLQEATTGAFAYDGNKVKAWKTQKRWNQGVGSSSLPDFTVSIADGLQRVKDVVGHYFAEQNTDIQELSFDLTSNQDVIDPVYMLWNRLTIAAEYDPRGIGWSNNRMIPTRITKKWERAASGINKALNLSLQPETYGQPGELVPIGNVKTAIANGWSITSPVPYTPLAGESIGSLGLAIAINDTGEMAVTYNYLVGSPVWEDFSTRFTGNICDFDWDYDSDYYTTGGLITSKLGVYVVSVSGTTLYVYHIEDIKDPGSTITELTTETMNDSSVTTEARVVCSETTPSLVVVAWKDQTGTEFIRSTNSGATWSSKANIGSTISDTNFDNAPLGLDIVGDTQLISAPDSTPQYGLYKATTPTGSFSQVTNTELRAAPFTLVKYDGTLVYVSVANTAGTPTSDTVTFDAGGFPYTGGTGGTNLTGGSIGTGGNPGNCSKGGTILGTGGFLNVGIDLGSDVTINDITVDLYFDELALTYTGSHWTIGITNDALFDLFGDPIDNPLTRFAWTNYRASEGNLGNWAGPYVARYVNIHNNFDVVESSGTIDLRIDNITIEYTSGSGDTAELYSVTIPLGSSVWSDISPVPGQSPQRPHDLNIDRIDSDNINVVGDNEVWYNSVNGGSTWSSIETASNKRTFTTQGNAKLAGGVGEIVLSLDGTTFDDKTGNLSTVWSSISIIKKVLAL